MSISSLVFVGAGSAIAVDLGREIEPWGLNILSMKFSYQLAMGCRGLRQYQQASSTILALKYQHQFPTSL